MPQIYDRRLYFPSEGRRAGDFFALKIQQLWQGLNPRTWVPKASTLTEHYSSLNILLYAINIISSEMVEDGPCT